MLIEFMHGTESFTEPTALFRAETFCYSWDTTGKRWVFTGKGLSLEKGCGGLFPVLKCLRSLACEYNAHHGLWTQVAVDLPSSVLLFVAIQRARFRADGSQVEHTRKMLVLRPSEAEPLRRIVCSTTGHVKASQKSIQLEGKFSLLNSAQLEDQMGRFELSADCFPPARNLHHVMPDLVSEDSLPGDRMFEVIDIEKALRNAPTKGILRARRPGEATVTYTMPRRRL